MFRVWWFSLRLRSFSSSVLNVSICWQLLIITHAWQIFTNDYRLFFFCCTAICYQEFLPSSRWNWRKFFLIFACSSCTNLAWAPKAVSILRQFRRARSKWWKISFFIRCLLRMKEESFEWSDRKYSEEILCRGGRFCLWGRFVTSAFVFDWLYLKLRKNLYLHQV